MGRIAVPGADGLPRSADVVVIGGGIIGTATASFASRAGFDVVVLERRDGLGTLTTAASLECFRAQFDEAENISMMQESIAVFEDFASFVGVPDCCINLHQQGYLFLTAEDSGADAMSRRVEHQRCHGLTDVVLLDGPQTRHNFPFVGPNVVAATYRERDGWLSAHELTQGFAQGSSALFCLRTAASGIRLDAQGVAAVETARGVVSTRCVVVAAGPYSKAALSWVGLDVPLRLLRRQRVVLTNLPEVPPDAPMTIDQDTGAHWRPAAGGAALGWALPEEPGEPMETVPAEWTFSSVALEGVSRLVPFWAQVGDSLARDSVLLSAGQYTCTPDHKPVIGPCGSVPGLYANTGYSGHRIMASAGGARRLADLIADPSADPENPFRSERFLQQGWSACAESLVL